MELTPSECSDVWDSSETGRRYPTKLRFSLTPVNCELTIELPYNPQKIMSKHGDMTKYGGGAMVAGTYKGQHVTGDCYVEILGDWF